MPSELHLWRENPRTGLWEHQRRVSSAEADAWLRRFQGDEPGVRFAVGPRKPPSPFRRKRTTKGRDPRAPRPGDRVRLEWEDGDVTTSTLGSFFRENSLPAEDRDELWRKGHLTMGGGAAPRVRVVLVRSGAKRGRR